MMLRIDMIQLQTEYQSLFFCCCCYTLLFTRGVKISSLRSRYSCGGKNKLEVVSEVQACSARNCGLSRGGCRQLNIAYKVLHSHLLVDGTVISAHNLRCLTAIMDSLTCAIAVTLLSLLSVFDT